MRIGADMRREVFLIFKEGLNNIIRHSECTAAAIEFQITGGLLELKLSDNGKGFDPAQVSDGNGLVSIRQRAEKMGGHLYVETNEGRGTVVKLKVPLGRRIKVA
jgi:signal transduction histidine kinase